MFKKEKHMTSKAAFVPLTERYAAAVAEFRKSYALLAAADQRAGRVGFGIPVDVVQLRHSLANPNEAGSLQDDIRALLA
jgi:hypothetical protein